MVGLTSSGAEVIAPISVIETIQVRLDGAKLKLLSIALHDKSTLFCPESLQKGNRKSIILTGIEVIVEEVA